MPEQNRSNELWSQAAVGSDAVTAQRRILVATVVVATCTLVVKLAAAGKDLVVANYFGVSASLDAFLLAYLFPSFCVNVLAGSLQAAFVPAYVMTRTAEGETAAAAFAASTASMLLLALTFTAMVVTPMAMWIMPSLAGALPLEYVADATRMAALLAPLIVLNGLMYFWSGFLNSQERYAIPAFTPIVTPVCMAAAIIVAGRTYGAATLVFGILLGSCIELASLLVQARVAGQRRLFGVLRPTSRHKAVFSQFAAAAGGNILMGATLIVDQSFVASLGAGGVSTLSFGTKLTQVCAGIFAMAIATAVLPNASQLVARADWSGLRNTVSSYTVMILAVTLPVTAAFIYFSEDIVRLLFQRGAFDRSDTAAVSFVQSLSALQIPFFAWSILIVRVLSALNANVVLVYGSGVSLILDILLNYALVPVLGVAGTALATSIMYAGACIFLSISLYWRIRRIEDGSARIR